MLLMLVQGVTLGQRVGTRGREVGARAEIASATASLVRVLSTSARYNRIGGQSVARLRNIYRAHHQHGAQTVPLVLPLVKLAVRSSPKHHLLPHKLVFIHAHISPGAAGGGPIEFMRVKVVV